MRINYVEVNSFLKKKSTISEEGEYIIIVSIEQQKFDQRVLIDASAPFFEHTQAGILSTYIHWDNNPSL